jgi:hypothetical protein
MKVRNTYASKRIMYMIYENSSKEYKVDNTNKKVVEYPFSEKLLFDNNSIAIVTHEDDNIVRIGIVHQSNILLGA